MQKWALWAGATCLFALSSCGEAEPTRDVFANRAPKGLYENVEELPRLPYLRFEPAFEDSRALTIEDGLEFVQATGTWAVYRVTGNNPHIYMPGVDHQEVSYPEIARHHVAICSASRFFGAGFEGSERFNLRLYGARSDGLADQFLGEDMLYGANFGMCANPVDARSGDDDDVDLNYTYLAFGDPQPPVGTLVMLRMVGINAPNDGTERVTHDNAWPICCPTDSTCEVAAPPEPPDGGDPDGSTEPPDGGDPDGSTEPPDGADPDGSTEPPDESHPDGGVEPPEASDPDGGTESPNGHAPDAGPTEPPNRSDPVGSEPPTTVGPACSAFAPPSSSALLWLMLLTLGAACFRRS